MCMSNVTLWCIRIRIIFVDDEYGGMYKMISKNFYWWVVSFVALVGLVVNLVVDNWFVAGVMSVLLVVSAFSYLKYRNRGE